MRRILKRSLIVVAIVLGLPVVVSLVGVAVTLLADKLDRARDDKRGYQETDEAESRALLGPFGPRLVPTLLEAHPVSGGWFGREGLRLIGTFRVTPKERAVFEEWSVRAGWRTLPVPATVARLRDLPPQLATISAGRFSSNVGRYRGTGMSFDYFPCEAAPPEHVSRYLLALYDSASGIVTTVVKNFY